MQSKTRGLSEDATEKVKNVTSANSGIVVAGALAIDFACDYKPLADTPSNATVSPQLHTSNPSIITQTLGGVAHNVARAAHLIGGDVLLCSAVGNDLSGRAAIAQLKSEGFQTAGIQTLDDTNAYRTAQYVAVNDAHKNLSLAMADMSILESIAPVDIDALWLRNLKKNPPKSLVVDANWSASALHSWFQAGKAASAFTVFEPVSTAKATRIFSPPVSTSSKTPKSESYIPTFPNHLVDLISPNSYELTALHSTASRLGLFERQDWWQVIDAIGIPSVGLRTAIGLTTSSELADQGFPQQSIQLLPFMPTILTKLGERGVLLTMLLKAGDERLHTGGEEAQYILARNNNGSEDVGGLYMRLFTPEEILGAGEVVSVNGIGDTFIGAVVAGMTGGMRVEDCINTAQRAARLSLRSKDSVSSDVAQLSNYWRK